MRGENRKKGNAQVTAQGFGMKVETSTAAICLVRPVDLEGKMYEVSILEREFEKG